MEKLLLESHHSEFAARLKFLLQDVTFEKFQNVLHVWSDGCIVKGGAQIETRAGHRRTPGELPRMLPPKPRAPAPCPARDTQVSYLHRSVLPVLEVSVS